MSVDRNDCRCERLPGGHDVDFGWSIRRASHEKALLMVSISHDIFGIRTHYYRGRTGPCLKTGCPACERHMLSRWNGYLLAVDAKDASRILFEFTPPAAVQLDQAFKEFGSLRGLSIIAARTAKRANAKVVLTIKGINSQAHKLPADSEIWPILSHIWGLNEDAPIEEQEILPSALAEVERINESTKFVGGGPDDEWMQALVNRSMRIPEEAGVSLDRVNGSREIH